MDIISKNLGALQHLGQPIENLDTLIVFMIVSKLDFNTKREGKAQSRKSTRISEIIKRFHKSCADLLETLHLN